jgi:hypothetical protein
MYYKEEWINGILYWKSSPNGEWIAFTMQQYKDRCLKLENGLKNLNIPAVSKCEGIEREALLFAFIDYCNTYLCSDDMFSKDWVSEFIINDCGASSGRA